MSINGKEFNFSKLKIIDLQLFQHVSMFYAAIFSSYVFLKVVINVHFVLHVIFNYYLFVLYKNRCSYITFSFFQLNRSKSTATRFFINLSENEPQNEPQNPQNLKKMLRKFQASNA